LRDDNLAASRRRFERRWIDCQNSMQREAGVTPRRRGWVLILLAAAAGLTIGMKAPRRLRSRTVGPADRPMPYDLES